MSPFKKKFRLFLISSILGLFTVVVAIIGLSIAIKIVPLNEDLQKLTWEKKKLEKENKELSIKLNSILTLSELDRLAEEKLGMSSPEKMYYLSIQEKPASKQTTHE